MNSEKYQIGQRIEIHSQFRFATTGRSKSLIETNFIKCFKNGKIYEGRKFNKSLAENEKSFGISSRGSTAQKMVFDEMKILSSLSDSRFQKLIDIVREPSHVILILERVTVHPNDSTSFNLCSLFHFVQSQNERKDFLRLRKMGQAKNRTGLRERDALGIFHQIIGAVTYLHERDIAHRNLNIHNILYNRQTFQIKISNFLCAVQVTSNSAASKDFNYARLITHQELVPYIAPEMLTCKQLFIDRYHPKATDCWALGVILYFMIFYKLPFNDDNSKKLRRPEQTLVDILRINYASGDLNFIREIKLNEITEKIIRDLLRVDPSHRANSFIISAQLIKFGSEIEIEHSKKQTEAQVVPDFVAPLPLDQKIEKNNSEISHEVVDQSNSMILNFPVGWNKGKKPDLKRLEKVRGVTTLEGSSRSHRAGSIPRRSIQNRRNAQNILQVNIQGGI